MDKRVVIGLCAGGIVAVGIACVIFFKKQKKTVKSPSEEMRKEAIERLRNAHGLEEDVEPEGDFIFEDEPEPPREYILIEEGDVDEYKVSPVDDKPSLDDALEHDGGFSFNPPEDGSVKLVDENTTLPPVMVHEDLFSEKEKETVEGDNSGLTVWGTKEISFDEEGKPVFTDEEWISENGGIEQIWHEDYHDRDDYVLYSRDVAVWFPNGGVLVNSELEPMDVVESVGPTAFTKLISDPSDTYFVVNHDMMRLFELSINDCPIEEVMEEVYPTYNTSTQM